MKKILLSLCFLLLLLAVPQEAAAMISPDKVNAVADVMVWVVMCIVPPIGLWIFWKIHVIPEQVAKKRNHPQKDAIHMMCLLSLVMGGMLWPMALVWAYSGPAQVCITDGENPVNVAEQEKLEQA
ncbi:hypothetical protein PEDI_43710 [Persicobacter diffluens]|uniref:DUF3302 domain-containing protein n=2 Tax=Persicobacter diffluens TaxID=981 RepID=A0AAN5ALZ0_9BACT|nr:hypothetical protein PEDI_43710 [Persicobacter diffluens]